MGEFVSDLVVRAAQTPFDGGEEVQLVSAITSFTEEKFEKTSALNYRNIYIV
jgi:hypothetical protein